MNDLIFCIRGVLFDREDAIQIMQDVLETEDVCPYNLTSQLFDKFDLDCIVADQYYNGDVLFGLVVQCMETNETLDEFDDRIIELLEQIGMYDGEVLDWYMDRY